MSESKPSERTQEESERLARRLLAGEEQAFLDFQRIYRRLFLSQFLALRIPMFEAEDLAISCLTDILCQKLSKWHAEGGNFDAWVLTIARNTAYQWLREKKRLDVTPLADMELPNRDEDVPDAARAAAVHDALERLSPSDRMIIELREFEGDQGYAEIAVALTRVSQKQVTEGAARVRHKRALERLGNLLSTDPRIRIRHDTPVKGEEGNERHEEQPRS